VGLGASRGKGRIQKAVARAFAASRGDTITTSQAYDFALARVWGDLWRQMHRCSVLRALDQVADRIGRDRRHGAIVWRLRTPLRKRLLPPAFWSVEIVTPSEGEPFELFAHLSLSNLAVHCLRSVVRHAPMDGAVGTAALSAELPGHKRYPRA
jgi:hypothetical protein